MEHLKEKPYIGVTGITLPTQAEAVAKTFVDEGLANEQSSHQGMIGVLVSKKTLSSTFQARIKYPTVEQISQMFRKTKGIAFNTIHYHTYQEANLAQQLEELLDRSGLYSDRLCEGLQLNVAWPPVTEVEKTKLAFPDLKIIMQLGPRVSTEEPQAITYKLDPYTDLVDYVLIDPSGGRKKVPQVNTIVSIFNQIKGTYPDLPLVFAGGFDAKNVKTRLGLLAQAIGTTNFGIDAEGGLRIRRRNTQLPTPLSIARACRYVQNAALFLNNIAHTKNY